MLQKIRKHGLAYSFAIAFNKLVPQRLFRFRRFVVYQLRVGPEFSKLPTVETLVCESEAEFKSVEELTGYYFWRGTNQIAVRADVEDVPAGGMWATADPFLERELGVEMVMMPMQCWLFSAQVANDYRRQGVYSQVLDRLRGEMAQRKFTHPLVAVNPFNRRSNRIHAQAAYETIGYVTAIRIFKTTICFCSGRIDCETIIGWNSDRQPIRIRCHTSEPRSPEGGVSLPRPVSVRNDEASQGKS